MNDREEKGVSFLRDLLDIATSPGRIRLLYRTSLYSNALYLMVATGGTAVLGFVFWILAARYYSPAEVGLASATIASMGLIASLSRLGLEYGLVRFLHGPEENRRVIINTVLTIGFIFSVIGSFVFLAGLGLWSPAQLFLRQDRWYLAGFVVFTIVTTISPLVDHVFVAHRRAGYMAARGVLSSLVKLPLPVILAGFFASFGIFASWGLGLTAGLLISLVFFLPRAERGFRPVFMIKARVVRSIFGYSFANYAGDLLWSLPGVVFPMMVVNLLGADLNAYYYIAWAIAGVLIMIPTSISTSLFAEGSYEEDKLGVNIRRSLKMVSVTLLPAVLIVLLIGDKILLLYGSDYSAEATPLLRILALATLPLAVNIIYLGIKRVQKDLTTIVVLTMMLTVVTLVVGYALLPRLGINGAGWGWLIGQSAALVFVLVQLFRSKAR